MAKVDPYVNPQWPMKWVSDPEIQPTIQYLDRYLHDLRVYAGVDEDLITKLTQFDFENFSPSNQGKLFTARIQTTNYTAVDGDFVEGRNGITIKLDSTPSHNDQIITCNGDGKTITIDGNGVQLRYKGKRADKLNISNEGTSIHWYRFADGTEQYWRAS